MLTVRARAPTRVDLAGGTLDLWPIHHLLDHKATVNVGVTLEARVEVGPSPDRRFHLLSRDQGAAVSGSFGDVCATTQLPLLGELLKALWSADLPPLTITTAAESPAGAGLGGSSCLGIAVASALFHVREQVSDRVRPAEEELVRTVQDVEARLIRAPTGVQDYWGGVRGRVNILTYPYGRTLVETVPPQSLAGLRDELSLCFSGRSRASAINNWEIFKRLFDGDAALLATFNEIGLAAERCADAVRHGDLARTLAFSEEEWRLRVRLWPNIETAETRRLDAAAQAAGARFTRVCGAGGGGVMAVFAPASRRADVQRAMTEAGGTILGAVPSESGLTVDVVS